MLRCLTMVTPYHYFVSSEATSICNVSMRYASGAHILVVQWLFSSFCSAVHDTTPQLSARGCCRALASLLCARVAALFVMGLVSLLPTLNVLSIALRVAVLCSLHCADRHAYAGGLGPLRHLRLQDVGAICASCLLLHDHTGMRYQWPRHAVHLLARSCVGLNWLCALGKL
jgi:hypothetical protein